RPEHVEYYNWIREMLGEDGEIRIDLPFPELKDLYANAYCVVYSPMNEDFGIVPLEAMSSRKPCIAVNEGGPKEIITPETGFLVNSVEEMAGRMQYLSERPEDVEGMGKKGRAYVEKNFSWERFLSRFKDVCMKVGGIS
ncbi:MAG: glycosyltransferase, partial [Candidatus Micrarchaeota archaeon]